MTLKHSLEQIVNVTKDIYKTSSLTDCFFEFIGNKLVIQSIWSLVDLDKNEKLKFQKPYFFEVDKAKDKLNLLHIGQSQPIRNDIWNVKSPNNLMNAILTTWKENGEDKQFLELWKEETRIENVNLTKLEKHSKIYESSACLGSFVWSSDSTKLAYVTEIKNTNKEKSFFTAKLSSDQDSLNENNYEKKYANYQRDEWGELYVGKSQSTIAFYDIESKDVKVLENIPDDFSPANIAWYENKGLVFSAYYTKPYRLGLIYCPIRKSELFYYDISENKCIQLTNFENENLRDPQFSNDYENLIWLQNQARGPHFQCSKLMIMNWKTKEVKTLVEIVNDTKDANDFPGIYNVGFNKNCWSLDNKRIVLNTQWHGRNRIISVDVETKKVTNLNNEIDEVHSLNIVKIENDWICGILQSYNKTPSLVLAKLPQRNQESSIEWFMTKTRDSLTELADIELLNFTPKIPDQKFPNLKFQSIFVQAKNRNDTLVVFPHGGPHSAYGCEYNSHVAILFSLGYSVLMINFRGSTGFGQNSIDSLPGKIGTNDVNDCQEATEYTMEKYKFKKAVLYGGSHGGYLTTQLIGQFPDYYSAAAARNPVTHLDTMLFTSDIPDWIITEGLGVYDYDFKMVGSEIPKGLYEKSPISHVNKVKTPILLMIGNVDLRVPCSQSIEYYKALKARDVPVKLLSFKEDSHPLDKPYTTADCIVHTLLWYEKYIQ